MAPVTDELFAGYLASLPRPELEALLARRPDALTLPAPRNFLQLAQRLNVPASVSAAIWQLSTAGWMLSHAIGAIGSMASAEHLAAYMETDDDHVRAELEQLRAVGLAWTDGHGIARLTSRLRQHIAEELGGDGWFIDLAQNVRVDELRRMARAYGIDGTTLRKQQLVDILALTVNDREKVLYALQSLRDDDWSVLDLLMQGDYAVRYITSFARSPQAKTVERLAGSGLVLLSDSGALIPYEIAQAMFVMTKGIRLPRAPMLPDAGADNDQVRQAARSAAEHALRVMVSLLDDAAQTPIAALKAGGVGVRERKRLARALSVPAEEMPLWIALAFTTQLLRHSGKAFAPSEAYAEWREAPPARQWASLALGWLALGHAPLLPEQDPADDPGVNAAWAGRLRRRLLPAAAPKYSVAAVGREFWWFCPLLTTWDVPLVGATQREAELLGIVALDSLSQLGQQLLDVRPVLADVARWPADPEAIEDLAAAIDTLISTAPCTLVLQSDLTAIVSGRPATALARVLRAAAAPEARGSADIWRFSPASVREALDAGWTVGELTAELTDASGRDLPPSLTQLFADISRRHGEVRIREVRTCLIATESLAAEIRHTRSLASLHFAQPAPTVLTSEESPEEVLISLRAAGFYPVRDDVDGTVTLAERPSSRAISQRPAAAHVQQALTAEQLANILLTGDNSELPPVSPSFPALAELNRGLNSAEVDLLATALDSGGNVTISYVDQNGSRTVRTIAPLHLYDRWIEAWCHLRNAERDFAVANIVSVSPV